MSGLDARRIVVRTDGTLIIDGVDVSADTGTFTAVVGPNGAGKSTLLRALAAIESPAAGSVHYDGVDLLRIRRGERARLVTLVEQDAATELPLSVRDVVALGRTPHQLIWGDGDPRAGAVVEAALRAVEMADFADRDVTTLSGGERQRVLLAKALAQEPRLLLLDEPTNHLDINSQLAVLGLLASVAGQGSTVIAALHDLNLAIAWCDRVVVLGRGRVVKAGMTRETLTPELILEVYGVEATFLENPETGRVVIAFSLPR